MPAARAARGMQLLLGLAAGAGLGAAASLWRRPRAARAGPLGVLDQQQRRVWRGVRHAAQVHKGVQGIRQAPAGQGAWEMGVWMPQRWRLGFGGRGPAEAASAVMHGEPRGYERPALAAQRARSITPSCRTQGLVDFRPHYLIWVCQGSSSKEECDSQCIRDGAYCCPDPDDNIHQGYSGADVLKVRPSGEAHRAPRAAWPQAPQMWLGLFQGCGERTCSLRRSLAETFRRRPTPPPRPPPR